MARSKSYRRQMIGDHLGMKHIPGIRIAVVPPPWVYLEAVLRNSKVLRKPQLFRPGVAGIGPFIGTSHTIIVYMKTINLLNKLDVRYPTRRLNENTGMAFDPENHLGGLFSMLSNLS
ncbi:MAG: hypothetical protein QM703_14065 [Gemmatales bacterium]